jgi:chitinase
VSPEEQANTAAFDAVRPSPDPRRHLSWWRIVALVAALLATSGALAAFRTDSARPVSTPVSTFAPYVDVTATPQFAFEDPTQVAAAGVFLGFVVSPADATGSGGSSAGSAGSPSGSATAGSSACQPSWGGTYSLDAAGSGLDLDRRIARLHQRGGQVAVSFGGAANSELAIGCTSTDQLTSAYQSVVDRYSVNAIDFDIETPAADTDAINRRRAEAVKALQRSRAAAGHPLFVWLTLPVNPTGLTDRGLAVLTSMLSAKVDVAGLNALTMDYSESGPSTQAMAPLSLQALTSVQRQVSATYLSAGQKLTVDQSWQKIGATPMIGQNDIGDQRFELADAQTLVTFAKVHHLARLSMWSANRDQACGVNYANPEVVSDQCSGVDQQPGAYGAIFDSFSTSVRPVTRPMPSAGTTGSGSATGPGASNQSGLTDDPATSPYPIWNASGAYSKNTKIVWHHNVYEAKWWTESDVPDAPVTDPNSTPWVLIGPVLPGEHPVPLPTLSIGTYPDWDPGQIYVAGQRVLLEGVGYQAKWWTQGQVPEATPLQPSDTPWQLLGS